MLDVRCSTFVFSIRCLPALGGARGDQGSMFKLLRLQLRLNLHITLKLHIQVRSSELGRSPYVLWFFMAVSD